MIHSEEGILYNNENEWTLTKHQWILEILFWKIKARHGLIQCHFYKAKTVKINHLNFRLYTYKSKKKRKSKGMLNPKFRIIVTPGYEAMDSEKSMRMPAMEIGLVGSGFMSIYFIILRPHNFPKYVIYTLNII